MPVRVIRLILFIAVSVLVFRWTPVDTQWVSSEGMLFFVIGGVLQNNSELLHKRLPKYWLGTISCIWLLLSFHSLHFIVLQKLNIIVGIISFWGVLDYLESKTIDRLIPYSFIIYVLHFYLIKIMKIGLSKLFYANELVSLFAYILLPLLCSALIIVLAKIMQKYLPKFYRIATGGR